MSDPDYCYPPDFTVLRNKLNIRSQTALEKVERQFVAQRSRQGAPSGNFDLLHLRNIHYHLFQDVYEWAGKIRTVEIAKDGLTFQFRRYIETGLGDIHRRLVEQSFLANQTRSDFSRHAGRIIGDLNYVHPFREGNGRTQLQYLKQLCDRAGHPIDLTRLNGVRWIEASRQSHSGDYEPMSRCIALAIDIDQ